MTRTLPFEPIQANEIWQFPMDYPLKVIGVAVPEFIQEIQAIVLQQFPNFNSDNMVVTPSRTGKFYAIRLQLHFSSADTLNSLYAALHSCNYIKTVI